MFISVESLEDHRSPNANSSYNMAIKSIEWLGFYEAAKISVKSEWMKDEVVRIYKVPKEKITVISTDPSCLDKRSPETIQKRGGGKEE